MLTSVQHSVGNLAPQTAAQRPSAALKRRRKPLTPPRKSLSPPGQAKTPALKAVARPLASSHFPRAAAVLEDCTAAASLPPSALHTTIPVPGVSQPKASQYLAQLAAEVEAKRQKIARTEASVAKNAETVWAKLEKRTRLVHGAVNKALTLELDAEELELEWRNICAKKFGKAMAYDCGAGETPSAQDACDGNAASMCCDEESIHHEDAANLEWRNETHSPKRKRDAPGSGNCIDVDPLFNSSASLPEDSENTQSSKRSRRSCSGEEVSQTMQVVVDSEFLLQQELEFLKEEEARQMQKYLEDRRLDALQIKELDCVLQSFKMDAAKWTEKIALLNKLISSTANENPCSGAASLEESNCAENSYNLCSKEEASGIQYLVPRRVILKMLHLPSLAIICQG